ncbi:hypothetical protein [Mesorhizobium sp. CN2-181]|uniref:hypothetical protein n=1 Tax=Mesorhizobium yinganensis TaxID=3157707 RepID=UPI0032B76502
MAQTVEELKKLKDDLTRQRRIEAYNVTSATNHGQIERLSQVHVAITALEAVIAEGKDTPEVGPTLMVV